MKENEIGEIDMLGELPEMPAMTPERLVELFNEGGRALLMKELCIFDELPLVNKAMEAVIDLTVGVFEGRIPIESFPSQMAQLNEFLHESLVDSTLDQYGEGNLRKEDMKEVLDILEEKKTEADDRVKEL